RAVALDQVAAHGRGGQRLHAGRLLAVAGARVPLPADEARADRCRRAGSLGVEAGVAEDRVLALGRADDDRERLGVVVAHVHLADEGVLGLADDRVTPSRRRADRIGHAALDRLVVDLDAVRPA